MAELKRPSFASGVIYQDPKAALDWLEKAFGFEPVMVVINEDGTLGHSEMRFGDGLIYVGREWDENHKSPASLDGKNTQSLSVHLASGLDAHCERARQAGAVIVREPVDQFYGDRSYMALDPEGHVWSFSQTLKEMSFDEMKEAGGRMEIRERL
ncbi:MAG TPA: VOC family protein [Caulobacteraceae bacterium]